MKRRAKKSGVRGLYILGLGLQCTALVAGCSRLTASMSKLLPTYDLGNAVANPTVRGSHPFPVVNRGFVLIKWDELQWRALLSSILKWF